MTNRENVLFALDCYAEQRETCGTECPYSITVADSIGGPGYVTCDKISIARDAITLIKQKPLESIAWPNPVKMCGSEMKQDG